jgi:hypothetical protein
MFNIQAVIYQVLASLATTYGPVFADFKMQIEFFLNATKDRLQNLEQDFVAGNISKKFVLDRLADELTLLKLTLESFAVEGESIAQDAYNNAVGIVTGAFNQIVNPVPAAMPTITEATVIQPAAAPTN